MSSGSNIPGPRPPQVNSPNQTNLTSSNDQVSSSIFTSSNHGDQQISDLSLNRIDAILNRPTTELLGEFDSVASQVIVESKTVGGLGTNILTACALVAASPWSWIGMLLFGPIRVWSFFYTAVIGGIGTALGMALVLISLFIFSVIVFGGWVIFRALS